MLPGSHRLLPLLPLPVLLPPPCYCCCCCITMLPHCCNPPAAAVRPPLLPPCCCWLVPSRCFLSRHYARHFAGSRSHSEVGDELPYELAHSAHFDQVEAVACCCCGGLATVGWLRCRTSNLCIIGRHCKARLSARHSKWQRNLRPCPAGPFCRCWARLQTMCRPRQPPRGATRSSAPAGRSLTPTTRTTRGEAAMRSVWHVTFMTMHCPQLSAPSNSSGDCTENPPVPPLTPSQPTLHLQTRSAVGAAPGTGGRRVAA